MWIESLGLFNSDKNFILTARAWLYDDHLNAAFTLLYEDILKYRGYKLDVVRPDTMQMKVEDTRNQKIMVSKSCLQFHHTKLGGNDNLIHWFLLQCYHPSDFMVECHVYDTLINIY